jgi:hypothetical protein
MKDYLKLLPLCLVIGSSTVFASDIPDSKNIEDMKVSQENIKDAITLKRLEKEYANINFQNTFVNVEVQEVIVQNVKKSFDEIDKGVKATGDQMKLDAFFQSLGKVQETNIFNFTKVATNKQVNFDNSYTRRYMAETRKQDLKNSSITSAYKSIESANSYKFEFYLDRFGDKSMQLFVKGNVNTEYGSSDEAVKDNIGKEHSGMKNSFQQESLLRMNEYTILSSDVKDAGVDNKTRESRFFIIKITEVIN